MKIIRRREVPDLLSPRSFVHNSLEQLHHRRLVISGEEFNCLILFSKRRMRRGRIVLVIIFISHAAGTRVTKWHGSKLCEWPSEGRSRKGVLFAHIQEVLSTNHPPRKWATLTATGASVKFNSTRIACVLRMSRNSSLITRILLYIL